MNKIESNSKPHNWTPEEEEILKELYPTTTVSDLMKILNINSRHSIHRRIKRLGLSKRQTVKKDGYLSIYTLARRLSVLAKKVFEWIEEEGLPYISRNQGYKNDTIYIKKKDFWEWAENHRNLVYFSRIEPNSIGEEPDWVDEARKKDQEEVEALPVLKRWEEEEEEILNRFYGEIPVYQIERKLDRRGVIGKIEREKLGKGAEFKGYFTANQLSKTLNVDSHTVINWVNKYDLPHKRKILRYERKYILIEPPLFWKWAEQNKELINFSKIERRALLPEPDWLEEERRKDYFSIPKKQNKPWSPEQDRQLWHLRYKKGLMLKDIAKTLDRSYNAVQRRLKRLKEKREEKLQNQ